MSTGPDVGAAGPEAAAQSAADPARRRFAIPERFFRLQSYLGLVLVFVAAIIFSPRRSGDVVFLEPENLLNIVRATSEIGITAVGMTFVILVGGIALSVRAGRGRARPGAA